MWHARAALLVLLAVAWNADVEGLPVKGSDVGHASLGETTMQPVGGGAPVIRKPPRQAPKDPNAPQNAQTLAAEASVAGAQAKVDAALAQVNGVPAPSNPRVAAAVAGQPLPSTPGLPEARDMRDPSAVKNAQPMTVRTPSINPNQLVDQEATFVKPPPEEFINRFLKPGDDGYVRQQAEEPIYTANHQLHHINLNLQLDRDRKYDVARGSKEVLLAAQAGSKATADMANAVREQEETDVAHSEAKIRNIKDEIAEAQFKDKGTHAKLQLALVREQKKHASLLARAKTMGDAVNVAIDKAGDIEGRARAQYSADMDPQMELAEAIVDAAQAKMALDEHDKQVAEQNKQAAEDEKQKKYFAKVQQKGAKALEKIEADGEAKKQAQEEADYQADIAAAAKAQQASMAVGTMDVPANMQQTMSEEDITEEEKQNQLAQKNDKQNNPGVVPAKKTDQQATADYKQTVANAQATGRPEDVKKATKAIDALKQVKSAKTPKQTVDEMTNQSNDLAKMAKDINNDKPTTPSAAPEPAKPTSAPADDSADAPGAAPPADAPTR